MLAAHVTPMMVPKFASAKGHVLKYVIGRWFKAVLRSCVVCDGLLVQPFFENHYNGLQNVLKTCLREVRLGS